MRIRQNINLARYTTFRLGGPADYFTVVRSLADLKIAFKFAKLKKLGVFILGGGSNIVIPDLGIRSLVVKMEIKGVTLNNNSIVAGAGVNWDDVVKFAVNNNLSGIENLSLIPGTVGGAVYQNIGAYGSELKDILGRVQVWDMKLRRVVWLPNSRCAFGYRTSIFRKDLAKRYIIIAVELELSENFSPNITYPDLLKRFSGNKIALSEIRRAVIGIRKAKLSYPPQVANAGSFFKNPVITNVHARRLLSKYRDIRTYNIDKGRSKLSSAQLIELAGWKGKHFGGVGVSPKHALVLVNHGHGTATELALLAKKIQLDIQNKFGVKLEPEVEVL